MAVTVELIFTDEQWALILEHYKPRERGGLITTTEEFAASNIQEIERRIIKQINKKARENNQNVFRG
tara:strand:- start:185 stop:385 length:201 start_codon:yes stop_codon:yes gene_type:complete